MTAVSEKWRVNKRSIPEKLEAIREAERQSASSCRVIKDDSGFWVMLSKGG